MKKIWSLFLTVCIVSALFGSIPVIVSAEINSTDNNLMIPKENFSVLNDSLEESVNSTTAIVSDNSQNVDVFAGGNGTAENPYQVATPEQLNEVRNYLSAYFIQICDIDMTDATSENGIFWNDGAGWLPIGTEQTPFTGRFNGQNYKIKGLNIYKLNNGCAGLFGYLGENSLIQNVQLVNGQYQLDISDVAYGVYIGGIVVNSVSRIPPQILNCINCNDISVYGSNSNNSTVYLGGITSRNAMIVAGCANVGNITIDTPDSGLYVGGIIGYKEKSSYSTTQVTNCYNTGTIEILSYKYSYIGGIVGYMTDDLNGQCYNSGDIRIQENELASFTYIGGISGMGTNITNCYNTGNIISLSSEEFSNTECGGITGKLTKGANSSSASVTNCYNAGSISGGDGIGNIELLSYPDNKPIGRASTCYSCDFSPIDLNRKNISLCSNFTIEEMQKKENFVGFNFDTIWDISPDQNNGLPYLRNMPPIIEQSPVTTGDVNGDSKVNFQDAQLVLQHEAGLVTFSEEQLEAADVNGDGRINFQDAQLILQYEAGLIDSFDKKG